VEGICQAGLPDDHNPRLLFTKFSPSIADCIQLLINEYEFLLFRNQRLSVPSITRADAKTVTPPQTSINIFLLLEMS
jgi:hypothetical protein